MKFFVRLGFCPDDNTLFTTHSMTVKANDEKDAVQKVKEDFKTYDKRTGYFITMNVEKM